MGKATGGQLPTRIISCNPGGISAGHHLSSNIKHERSGKEDEREKTQQAVGACNHRFANENELRTAAQQSEGRTDNRANKKKQAEEIEAAVTCNLNNITHDWEDTGHAKSYHL